MSRKGSPDLFELVRSLTPSEKRSFRIAAEKDGSPLYLQLYTAIEKQAVYDEARILKAVKQIRPSQLSNLKAYLYDLLLGHLRGQLAGKEVRAGIYEQLSRADVLYEKGLYAQCSELLKKLKRTCREKDNHLVLLAAIEREVNIIKKDDSQWHLLEEKYAEKKEIVSLLARNDNYRYVRDTIGMFLANAGTVRNAAERKKMQALKSLLPKEAEVSTTGEKKIYHNVMYRYNFAMRYYTQAYYNIKKLVELYEKEPGAALFNYIVYLTDLAEMCILVKRYDEAQQVLHKLKHLKVNTPREAQRCNDYYYFFALSLNNAMVSFERTIELKKEFTPKPSTNVVVMLATQFYAAVASFCLGDLRAALKEINPVLNHPKTPAVWNLQCLARVLNLLIHYELNNDELLAYNLRSTYRYLMQKGFLDPFEKVILEFVRKFCRYIEPGNERKMLRGMYEKLLKTLENDKTNSFGHSHYNIVLGLGARLEKKPISELVKEIAAHV